MASDKTLKFYKGENAPIAAIGSVWFNTGNRTIQVKTGSGSTDWEVYTGLIDATYNEGTGKLEITKAKGDKISLDFSDCASAATLSEVSGKVDGLVTWKDTASGQISTLEGEMDTVQGVAADAAAAIAVLNGAATEAGSVAKAVKDAVDAEAAVARAAEKANADAISTLNTTVTGHGTTIEEIQETLAGLTGGEGSIDSQITAKIAELDADITSAEGTNVRVQVVEVDGKITEVKVTDVSASAEDLSDEITRATKKEGELETAISTEKARIDKLYAGSIEVDGKVIPDEGKSVRAIAAEEVALIVNGADTAYDTLKEIADWIAAHPESVAELNAAIQTNATAIAKLNGGVDADGSVAKTAKSYADAAQSAAETKAEELADAAQEAGESAAAKAYDDAKAYTDALASGAVATNATAIATLDTYVKDLDVTDTAVAGQYVSAVSQADGKITVSRESLPSATVGSTTIDTGKHVAVEVVEENGKLTGLTVTESDIASAEALSTLSTRVEGLATDLTNA